ncbi:MAG: response regulator [Halobacteriovoraceae bacterium]|jgi:two-component system, chemotaxis family, chemotaxis protein CheY|nr:response regulator [Halobacteriovoraceae bacterium]
MKVLIVDDSNSIAMVVGQMLKTAGYEVERAKDGKDAINVIKENSNIEVVLLDWNMPEMDGLEFLQYNLEHKIVNGPIIMMTTENKPEKIMKALENGASEYIMKPFTQDVLITKIESVTTGGE